MRQVYLVESAILESTKCSAEDNYMSISLRDERGQGVIEYILVLMVATALILGGVFQLNDAFRHWANNYFGEYLACVLESGELPTIGGIPGDSGICNELFQPFSITQGRPRVGRPIGAGTGSGGGGGSESGTGERENTGRFVRTGGGGGGGSAGVRESGGRFQPSFATAGGTKGASFRAKKSGTYTGSTENSLPASALRGNKVAGAGAVQDRLVDTSPEGLKRSQESGQREKTLGKKSEERKITAQKRFKVQRKMASTAAMIEDQPLSFGDYFRFLLIAAIIIAVAVFFGGQILQISKSLD